MNVNVISKALDALLRGTMRIASLMKPEGTEMDDPILCDRCSEELPEDFLTVAYVLRSTTHQDVQRICQDCHDRAD
jgi:hypothetical protein